MFGKSLELFLEHPYAVAGRDAKLNVHLTVMADGTPIRSGTLRVVATSPSGKSNSVEQHAPRSPGIYGPTVAFPEPGKGELTLTLRGDQAHETLLVPVEVYRDEAAALQAAEAEGRDEPPGAVPFLKEQQWKIGLVTQLVARHDLMERLVVPGEVLPSAGSKVLISPPVSGRLLPPPAGGFPRVGETVRPDQVVAAVEPPLNGPQGVQFLVNQAQIRTLQTEILTRLMGVEVEIREAQLDLEHARRLYDMTRSLASSEVIGQRPLIERQHALHIAEIAYQGKQRMKEPYEETLKKVDALLGETGAKRGASASPGNPGASPWQAVQIALKAPQGGTVTSAQAVAGEFVEVGKPLFTVINLDRVWIEAKVSEFDLDRVVEAPSADLTLAAHRGRRFAILGKGGGMLIDVGSVVDPQSRTVPVRYEIPNSDHGLRIGLLADVAIETQKVERVIAVPESAIVEEEGRPIAYALLDGESFQRRDLELGLKDRGLVEIKRGLDVGERVVTKGAYAIRLSAMSGVIPAHGHTH
jgi:multidrug efflux pump subunit AcrA (membrane-fusion protein)